MLSSKVLVPTDFTPAANKALSIACDIARKTNGSILLLHIRNNHTKTLLGNIGVSLPDLEVHLSKICQDTISEKGVKCEFLVVDGDIMNDINRVASDVLMSLMVIGTHGKVGLRQNLFGADLLKIASKCPIPVLVVTERSDLNNAFEKIVFPYGSHVSFQNKIDATTMMASTFGSEVHIYTIDKAGDEPTKQTLNNVDKARRSFESAGVKHIMVHDKSESYSVGFARQTLKYADGIGAKLISIMSVPSSTHGFISNSDKEIFIENEQGINLLMTSDY